MSSTWGGELAVVVVMWSSLSEAPSLSSWLGLIVGIHPGGIHQGVTTTMVEEVVVVVVERGGGGKKRRGSVCIMVA